MPARKHLFFFIIIAIGLLLRLIWTSDMEWKGDELQMYTMAHEAVNKAALPAVGMVSGGGVVNPGMSVWVFAGIAQFTDSPITMDRMVQIINVIAILCFLLFIWLKIDYPEKEIWLSGIALAAISPLAVLFSRKIWAQDLLPFFCFLVIFANSYRNRGWGAFLWGVTGALIGQIHMSGFFFAAGLFIFTALHDHFNNIKFRWALWFAGSIIGSITLAPWILFILHNPQYTGQSLEHVLQFSFYRFWFLDAHGLNIYYSLHENFWDYLKEPILFGKPIYIVAFVHLFLIAVAVFSVIQLLKISKDIFLQIRQKVAFQNLFKNISITKFYLLSILLGLGILMTLTGTEIYQHYLICAFPFQYIFLAKMIGQHKRLFRWVIIAQLIITITFLVYIHMNNGALKGDYGKAYHAQPLNQ